ncbi:MAG: sensor histidine kinase [Bacteroidales bacterium]|nr:sensor histidine kinase [Bacteroidales bacterium]
MRQREIQNLKEKEVLLKEIHHRVKNNLQLINSLLNLQAGSISDSETKTALIDSQNRVKSMALIHQLLYQSDLNTRVEISKYLEELMESLNHSYGFRDKHIQYVIRAEAIEFDIDKAIPLGLITNELATNAIKYAFNDSTGGKIEISLNKTSENQYTLQVKDNGTGIPKKFNHEKSNSLGINLVKLLAKQLEGNVEFESNGGTTIKISFLIM